MVLRCMQLCGQGGICAVCHVATAQWARHTAPLRCCWHSGYQLQAVHDLRKRTQRADSGALPAVTCHCILMIALPDKLQAGQIKP